MKSPRNSSQIYNVKLTSHHPIASGESCPSHEKCIFTPPMSISYLIFFFIKTLAKTGFEPTLQSIHSGAMINHTLTRRTKVKLYDYSHSHGLCTLPWSMCRPYVIFIFIKTSSKTGFEPTLQSIHSDAMIYHALNRYTKVKL